MSRIPELVRLSRWPVGGQGQPYGDDVVLQARELVETTWLTQMEIGARIGVSHMSVCRWARAGGWRRPPGSARPPDERGTSLQSMRRHTARTRPWRLLAEAEGVLAGLPPESAADVDALERALALLQEARALQARGIGPRRQGAATGSSHLPTASC